MSGLVRARGLKSHIPVSVSIIYVRARKSPWIEIFSMAFDVYLGKSGLVRARGLKLYPAPLAAVFQVRARKSPWIEIYLHGK